MAVTGKSQLARLAELVAANASSFDITSAGDGISESHAEEHTLAARRLQIAIASAGVLIGKDYVYWHFGTPFGVPKSVPHLPPWRARAERSSRA